MPQLRRDFLRHALRLGLASTLVGGLGMLGACRQAARRPNTKHRLQPTADASTGLSLLELPEGFRYFTFGWAGETLLDGGTIPASADGMGIVATAGNVLTLIRNHEIVSSSGAFGAAESAYDPSCGGGCVRLRVDMASESLISAEAGLSGTLVNCAGGVSPWGTWLSCEEIVVSDDQVRPSKQGAGRDASLQRPHGLVFEVDSSGPARARPIPDMGMFRHEAVAFDTRTGQAYLTEDRDDECGFYRFTPRQPGQLQAGGTLEMLAAQGAPDLRRGLRVGQRWRVAWVPIAQPLLGHTPGTHDQGGVVGQGLAAGGSRFIRLEGCLERADGIWFTSTSGGDAGGGQVWRLDVRESTLELMYEVRDRNELDYPDNIAEGPGAGMIICGDSLLRKQQELSWLGRDGRLLTVARNNTYFQGVDYRSAEWAGSCVSADGRWLFANIYSPGFTVAITGPWDDFLTA